ncbi:glycoside hydrolase family 15 protein, partial [Acrocarpospora phusangensis]|uniref:glycoside hydrolase family 15 protein n=1 Tax=Acrocarpospora phusangensis TaxID=1070424 RepID=UPI0019522100
MIVGSELTRADLARLAARSVELIDRHQSPSGAYPASPAFSAYQGYAWLRDGAFIAEGMSRAADPAGPSAFHAWCARVVGARAGQVAALRTRAARGETLSPADMLPTRFTLDGANGTADWWDHQLDGYGTWLWSLTRHLHRHPADIPGLTEAVRVATDYLTAFWHLPCYDWWEEHVDRRHTSTLAAIHTGLRSALTLNALPHSSAASAREAIEAISTLIATEGTATQSTPSRTDRFPPPAHPTEADPGSPTGQGETCLESATRRGEAESRPPTRLDAAEAGPSTRPDGVSSSARHDKTEAEQIARHGVANSHLVRNPGRADLTSAPRSGEAETVTRPSGGVGPATGPTGMARQATSPAGIAGRTT